MKEIVCGKYRIPLEKTIVMGILNVTPDSFYDGGKHDIMDSAIKHAKKLVIEGADVIDVGGESTRPGSEPVTVKEELKRVVPVIEALAEETSVPTSIDSYKPQVVEKAVEAGASMINDVFGLRSDGMAELAASSGLPVVIMHMQGTPKSMQDKPVYGDVVLEVRKFLEERAAYAIQKGVSREQVILDPGIGFGKTLEHNLELLRRLDEIRELGYPVLVGASRKSMIGDILGSPPQERLEGSLAVAVLAVSLGADIIRVHDVAETVRALRVADALLRV